MPKIYRGMKRNGDKPAIGPTSTTLGARVPEDIEPDASEFVHPNTGGMSVAPALRYLPAHRVPRRLAAIFPGATGNNEICVWSMGVGDFVDRPINAQLKLAIDPANAKHGLVEPAGSMPLSEYQNALAATQDAWTIDESGIE